MSSAETLANAVEEPVVATGADTGVDTVASSEQVLAPDHEQGAHDHHHPENAGPPLNPECTRSVDVTIPAEEVSSAFRRVVKNITRQARIPGFRAGKVPPSFIRSRFDEQIRQDVVEQLLPSHFRSAIEAAGVQPISQPQVTELELKDGEPLRFKALFEVMPEIDLTGYQEVKVSRETNALTEEEFETEVERLRDSRSTMEPVEEDRELAEGDYAQITFRGEATGDQTLEEPIAGQDVSLEVGGRNTLPAFSDALRGARPGQELRFEVAYPEGVGDPRLQGKTVAYTVEVKGIRRKNAPEMNDDFARSLGEYETLDEFKTRLREHLTADRQRSAEAVTKDRILEALASRYTFPVPETLVQQQVDARLERGLRALAEQGFTQEQMRSLNFARLRAAQRDGAIGEVQGTLLLDKIGKLENVEVSDAELDREIEMLSVQTREQLEALRKRLTGDGSIERIREQIRREKTGSLLYERLAS